MSKIQEIFWNYWNKLKPKFFEFKTWFLKLPRDKQAAFIIFIGLSIYTPFFFFGGKVADLEIKTANRIVEVVNVGELSNISTPLSLVGVVESVSEATVRAEGSGQLTRVYKKVGDRVFAGEVIATFENSAERAGVLQAEGVYEQAKAARDLTKVNLDNSTSGISLQSAQTQAVNSISNAYITIDDSVRAKTDTAFTNPRNGSLQFLPLAPDQVLLYKVESSRKEIEKVLVDWETKSGKFSGAGELEADLASTLNDLNTVKSYLDDLAKVYSIAIPNNSFPQTSIDAQKSIVSGARSAISGGISSINGAKLGLANAKAGSNISSGVKNPTVAGSDAQVKIALGSYQAALSRLSKTTVRSSITGTVNSITVKTGDYATPAQPIAVISNNNALLVTTYISFDDAKRVSVGSEVLVNGKIPGVVTRVAQALDPINKKIKIEIGFKNDIQTLTNGQSVRIEIKGLGEVKVIKTADTKILIPLSSVKVTPRGANVFFIAENILKAVPIGVGAISGNSIEVLSGISPEDNIIKDARGFKDGQKVEIKSGPESI